MPNPKHKGAHKNRPSSPAATSTTSARGKNVLTLEQVFALTIDVGFAPMAYAHNKSAAVIATATAFAENQELDANKINRANEDGSIDVGLWQINSVHSGDKLNPSPQWISRMQNPRTNAKEALRISGHDPASGDVGTWGREGGGGAPWYAYGTPAYHEAHKRATRILAEYLNDPSVLDRMGVVEGESIPETAAKMAFGITGWIAAEVGKASAKWFLGAVTWVGKTLWDEVFMPVWGRTQRATFYYRTEIMGEPYGFFVTIFFWSTGYYILWRKADDGSRAERSEDTAFGRTFLAARNASVKRKLYTPAQATAETSKKPPAKTSETLVTKTRSASVNRKRAVTVQFDNEREVDEVAQKRAEKEGAVA